MSKVVLITGVSKGLGFALAKKFKQEGFLVCGVSRTASDKLPVDKHIIADLTVRENIDLVYEEFFSSFEKIDVLINNAGIGMYERWKDVKEDQLKKLCELNFFSYVLLTQKFLDRLIDTKGTIINVSSVAGKLYVPYMGAYCASKAAVNMFSDSLRAELKPYGVNVVNLIIGRIETGFSSRAFGTKKPPKTPFKGSTEKFAQVVFNAYKKNKREVVYPYWYKLLILISKLFPDIYDKLALKSWEK